MIKNVFFDESFVETGISKEIDLEEKRIRFKFDSVGTSNKKTFGITGRLRCLSRIRLKISFHIPSFDDDSPDDKNTQPTK